MRRSQQPTLPQPDRSYIPGVPGHALAWVYRSIMQLRNRRFDRGRRVITFDRPVISVGNLSMGGTGKTPMVERIIQSLRDAGHDPCIAMRGYKARNNANQCSDEAALYQQRFDDLPIVAQPDRIAGLIDLFATERGESVDCIVLDDGYQHRQIARQINILLIDASIDVRTCQVVPAGSFREPLASLKRATHLVLTHAEQLDDAVIASTRAYLKTVNEQVSDRHPPQHPFFCSVSGHQWNTLQQYATPDSTTRQKCSIDWLAGKTVIAACAIGRPEAFLASLDKTGATIAQSFVLADHDPFSAATIDSILNAAREHRAQAVVLTAKDMTKLVGRSVQPDWPCPLIVPELTLIFKKHQPDTWAGLKQDILACVDRGIDESNQSSI